MPRSAQLFNFFYANSYGPITPQKICLWVFLQISQNTIQMSLYNPCDWSSESLSSNCNCQMPLECWPVVTFGTLTLIMFSLEHMKERQTGCFLFLKIKQLSQLVQQKLVPCVLALNCRTIYIDFLNACTVVQFYQLSEKQSTVMQLTTWLANNI